MTTSTDLINEIKANNKAFKEDGDLCFKTDGKQGGNMPNPIFKNQKILEQLFEMARNGDSIAIKFCNKQRKVTH